MLFSIVIFSMNIDLVCYSFRSHERTQEELELVFEELLHIPALSHLSTSIKRELAAIIVFESHAQAGTICKYTLSNSPIYWLTMIVHNLTKTVILANHSTSLPFPFYTHSFRKHVP